MNTISSAARASIINRALELLACEARSGNVLDKPDTVRDYLRLRLGNRPHEIFAVVFLDARNQVIDIAELFRGTLTQTSVYPREVVVEALKRNAAAVILAHNHPSDSPEPSRADQQLTTTLTAALALVDVRVLDHFIITRQCVVSFAERGLI